MAASSDPRVRIEGLLDGESWASALVDLSRSPGSVTIDLSGCTGAESVALAAMLEEVDRAARAGRTITLEGAGSGLAEEISRALASVGAFRPRNADQGVRRQFEDIGDRVLQMLKTVRGLARFSKATLRSTFDSFTHPRMLRPKQILYYMEQSGVQAVPIIAVLNWIMGVVLGFQAGYQLRSFAAESHMPELVAFALVWEIAPLLAAVLVAGRSGSAYAAELGTMQVRQEIDALRVMGMDPWSYLVTPKMIALLIVMPFLVLLADVAGLLGGMLIGGWYLDMTPAFYVRALLTVLLPIDIWWGMLKSLVYAFIIANVGSYMGVRVRGGAAEVGRATTSAVVTSIFLVVIADALISLIFLHVRPEVVV